MKSVQSISIAHPIQGLLCAHGYKIKELKILPVQTIYVALSCFHTKVRFSLVDDNRSSRDVSCNSHEIRTDEKQRIIDFTQRVLERFGCNASFNIEISQNFPVAIGIGSSSSLFASLTYSIINALGVNLSLKEISSIARLGSNSAAASVLGNVSIVLNGNKPHHTYAQILCNKDDFPFKIIVLPIEGEKRSEDIHSDIVLSPYYSCWLKRTKKRSSALERLLIKKDFNKIANLIETYIYEHFATIITGPSHIVPWNEKTVSTIMLLRKIRAEEQLNFFISMNSGPAVFIYYYNDLHDKITNLLNTLNFRYVISDVGGSVNIIE